MLVLLAEAIMAVAIIKQQQQKHPDNDNVVAERLFDKPKKGPRRVSWPNILFVFFIAITCACFEIYIEINFMEYYLQNVIL